MSLPLHTPSLPQWLPKVLRQEAVSRLNLWYASPRSCWSSMISTPTGEWKFHLLRSVSTWVLYQWPLHDFQFSERGSRRRPSICGSHRSYIQHMTLVFQGLLSSGGILCSNMWWQRTSPLPFRELHAHSERRLPAVTRDQWISSWLVKWPLPRPY